MRLVLMLHPLKWLLLLHASFAQSEVIVDGTLGHAESLLGPNYQISANLGKQVGNNLFHSFSQFNLYPGDSATFSGPTEIKNIISRVTGNMPSLINGTLRSTIPEADLYLLNPHGIIFGTDAKLDLSGSFHASTADYLRLGTDGQFAARNPNQSLLTVAAPSAFGFLTSPPAPITLHDSHLSVALNRGLSFIGGELSFKGTNPSRLDEHQNVVFDAELSATFGRIHLASLSDPGEVKWDETGLSLSPNMHGGTLRLENMNITTTGAGGGQVFVKAGQLKFAYSVIESKTLGDQSSGMIDIQGDNLALYGSKLSTSTWGSGTAGFIFVRVANDVTLSGTRPNALGSAIFSRVHENTGNGGNIYIQAQQLTIRDGGEIGTGTWGTGNGGSVHLDIAGSLTVEGTDNRDNPSRIYADTYNNTQANAGAAGSIEIDAQDIAILHDGQISSATWGTGQGGAISLKARDSLTLAGISKNGYPSSIFADSLSSQSNAGDGGTISVEAAKLSLLDGGQITAFTHGYGAGGELVIKVSDTLKISGLNVGNLEKLVFKDPTAIFAETSGVFAKSFSQQIDIDQVGHAGKITVEARNLDLIEGGKISTSTAQSEGGDIHLTVTDVMYLEKGIITTSVKGGTGNGGNIFISQPHFMVLDKSKIIAQAIEGKGGNIHLAAEQFIPSADSLVSASSLKGISGNIINRSPDNNISSTLVLLPTDSLDVSSLLDSLCYRQRRDISVFATPDRFQVIPYRGRPPEPEDWQSFLVPTQVRRN